MRFRLHLIVAVLPSALFLPKDITKSLVTIANRAAGVVETERHHNASARFIQLACQGLSLSNHSTLGKDVD